MQASELVDVIRANGEEEWREVAGELCGSCHELVRGKYIANLVRKLDNLGYVLASVDGFGGEGKGDKYYGIFSVTKNEEITYFRLNGWYASYDGPDIEYWSFKEVKKIQVQTFEWEYCENR